LEDSQSGCKSNASGPTECERTIRSQETTSQSRRAMKKLGACIYQVYLFRVCIPTLGKVIRCAQADDAAPKNHCGSIMAIAGAHRVCERGNEGHLLSLSDNRAIRFCVYNSQSMPSGTLCGESRHNGLLVAVFGSPWRDVEVSYDCDPTRYVGNGHRNTTLVSTTFDAEYS
jgi:hypothetical protein